MRHREPGHPASAPPKPGAEGEPRLVSKAARHESRQHAENAKKAWGIRTQMRGYQFEAESAERMAELVKSPSWLLDLLPMLEDDIRLYQEDQAWNAPGMSMDPRVETIFEARAGARRSKSILETVLTRAENGGQYYRDKAEELSEQLEGYYSNGLVSSEDLDSMDKERA